MAAVLYGLGDDNRNYRRRGVDHRGGGGGGNEKPTPDGLSEP